jgi:MraZ protein
MFSGEYEHNIDDKGRLIIPMRLRSELSNNVFVTRGLDNCLFVYPIKTWEELAAHLNQLPTTNNAARSLTRLLFSGNETALDKQGRISLAAPLREYANIELGSEVVVVGVNNRIELWNKDRWTGFMDKLGKEAADLANDLELVF